MGEGGDNFSILWEDTAVMRGDIELMGEGPSSPPTRENPDTYPLISSHFLLLGVLLWFYLNPETGYPS